MSSLLPQNAVVLMEQAHQFNDYDLRRKALLYIFTNGDEVLKSDEVTDLCHECLVEIVRSDELTADEKYVFEAALKWADSACKKQGKQASGENRREVLGEAVKHVRYPLLDQTYFVKHVTPTNILTETEENKILKHWVSSDEDVSPFNSNIRAAMILKPIKRFVAFAGSLSCSGEVDDAITFSVNKNTSLHGVQLYSYHEPQNYDVNIFVTDKKTDEILDGSTLKQGYEHVVPVVFDVMFRRPLQIIKDTEYSLFVNIEGGNTLCGYAGKSDIVEDSFTCRFSKSKKSKHSDKELRTDVTEGQIRALLFSM